MYSLALIIFVVSEKKAFEHFPIGSKIHRLTLDPMGKCSNAFFSETTNIIKANLYMNVHWMVLYKLYVFCSGMKFKMAATAGLSLTLGHLGFPIGIKNIKFVENLPMIIPGEFGFNCPSGFREEAF
jgi:hypothetical protein